MTVAEHTALEVLEARTLLRLALAANEIHIVRVLKDPDWWLESAVVGDVLCWCPGLDEADVTRILRVVDLNWGRRIALLREREKARIFYRIKTRYPEMWERWKESAK